MPFIKVSLRRNIPLMFRVRKCECYLLPTPITRLLNKTRPYKNYIMKQFFSLAILIVFFLNTSNAQSDLAIGQWKSHLPYQVGWYVTQSDTKVYFATETITFDFR